MKYGNEVLFFVYPYTIKEEQITFIGQESQQSMAQLKTWHLYSYHQLLFRQFLDNVDVYLDITGHIFICLNNVLCVVNI